MTRQLKNPDISENGMDSNIRIDKYMVFTSTRYPVLGKAEDVDDDSIILQGLVRIQTANQSSQRSAIHFPPATLPPKQPKQPRRRPIGFGVHVPSGAGVAGVAVGCGRHGRRGKHGWYGRAAVDNGGVRPSFLPCG